MIRDTIRKLLKNDMVPFVHVEGNDKITKIQWVGDVQKFSNTFLDQFSLILWELHSNSVEFFSAGKSLGWGYIGDIAGMTIDIRRNIKTLPETTSAAHMEPAEGISIEGLMARIRAAVPDGRQKPVLRPCVFIKGEKSIREVHFEYFQELEGALLDTRSKCRYVINPDTKIEITMPDGCIGTGWVCDATGQTVTIKRNVKVMGLVRDKHEVPKTNEKGEPVEIEVDINWSGRLGKRMTNDKLSILWSSAVSGREKLIFGVLLFIVGNLIGVVVHI